MTGKHIHNWIYNPVEKKIYGAYEEYLVIRFCDKCFKLEEIELKK